MEEKIKLKKSAWIINIISLVILIIFSAYFFYGTNFSKNKITYNYSNWMNSLKDDSKLSEVVLPGSHDSGTDKMSFQWSTQNSSIKEQLEMGVRYFDIRVNYTLGDYYIFHDFMIGNKFLPILDDIKNFISTHQSETLVLHFQHFKNNADEKIKSYLKEKLYDNNLVVENNTSSSDIEFLSSVTLKETRGKCVIVYGTKYQKNNFIFKEGDSFESYYERKYNTMNSTKFINVGLPYYINKMKEKTSSTGFKGLNVLQCQLTDKILIRGPWSRERTHTKNISNYINSLKDSSDLDNINIIMLDFMNEDKVSEVISLNTTKKLFK